MIGGQVVNKFKLFYLLVTLCCFHVYSEIKLSQLYFTEVNKLIHSFTSEKCQVFLNVCALNDHWSQRRRSN